MNGINASDVRRGEIMTPEPAETTASPVLDDCEVLSGDWTWVGDRESQLQFRPRR